MNKENIFVALGTFDGLHRGHTAVLTAGNDRFEKKFAVMFNEHPEKYIYGVTPGSLMTKSREKKELSLLGIEPVYMDFPDISDLTAEQFFYDVLIKEMRASAVSCGFNYRFGKNASGDAALLGKLCEETGTEFFVSEPVIYDGSPISSTRIRQALKDGEIKKANDMLGRNFSFDFEVVKGDMRGRTLGAPTINQFFAEDLVIPKYGVYASCTTVEGRQYPSVTNIGIRPTVGNSACRSETNIIGFSGDLYGEHVLVEIIDYIRGEMKFSSYEELGAHISADREAALKICKGRYSFDVRE